MLSVSPEGGTGHGKPWGRGCSEFPLQLLALHPWDLSDCRSSGQATPKVRPSTGGAVSHPCLPLTHRHEQGCSSHPVSSLISSVPGFPAGPGPAACSPRSSHNAAQGQINAHAHPLHPTSAVQSHFHTPSVNSVTFISFWGVLAPWMSDPFPYQLLGFLLPEVEEREQILLASCGLRVRKVVIWTDLSECLLTSWLRAPSNLWFMIAHCQWVWSHHEPVWSTNQFLHAHFISKWTNITLLYLFQF